jgi:hypothetical protein
MSIPVLGLYGESHTVPGDTLVSYWAALGAGGAGFTASVQITEQGKLFCGSDLQEDGSRFRSTALDDTNQPTGTRGKDTPWKKCWRGHPELSSVLQIFGRRCRIMLIVEPSLAGSAVGSISEKLVQTLHSFGLQERIQVIGKHSVCESIKQKSSAISTVLLWEKEQTAQSNVGTARSCGAEGLCIPVEEIEDDDLELLNESELDLFLSTAFYAFTPEHIQLCNRIKEVKALLVRGVAKTMRLLRPPSLVLSDMFHGEKIDRQLWACGYSHVNTDTTLSQDNGFVIDISSGGDYSGGAAVTRIPVHGDFDTRVDFLVESPQQATTFELAAIGIDPGYFNIDNSRLSSRKVNLTFDVHGTPPYASSERDEADGFRMGWNNSHNFVKIDSDWSAASANMFNKYTPDVGDGAIDNRRGTLRLTRCGSVFTSYYKDKYNEEWVCSGTALVHNLATDVFIRLAAKHWKKGGVPPANRVTFTNFLLFQF